MVPLSSYSLALACKLANLQFRLILKLSSVAFCHNLQCCILTFELICAVTKKKSVLLEETKGYQFHKILIFQGKTSKPGLNLDNVSLSDTSIL